MKKLVQSYYTQWVVVIILINVSMLHSQEDAQKRFKTLSGLQTKIDGVLYTGYEHWDAGESSRNPEDQDSGFAVTRAYINFRGNALNPSYKGWGYRFTLDFAPAANIGNGCDPNEGCSGNNDLSAYLKYAYFFIPLGKNNETKHQLIIGQQDTPFAADLQKIWGYRHVARSVLRQARTADSADRGLGIKSKGKNYKLHLLLGNGEGYHRNNADPSSSNASQALDLYGNLSLISADNKTSSFYVHLPFRFYNTLGLKEREKDLGEINEGKDLGRLRGFGRGIEFNYIYSSGNNGLKIGIGNYFLNRPGGHGSGDDYEPQRIRNQFNGRLGYFWLTLRSGIFGVFYSYYEGTTDHRNGRLTAFENNNGLTGRAIRRIYGITFTPKTDIAFLNISLGADSTHSDWISEDDLGNRKVNNTKSGDAFIRLGLSFEIYNSNPEN